MRDEVIYLILFSLIIFVFFVIKSMKKDQLNLIDEILGDAEYVSSKIKILYSITSNEDYSNYEFVQFVKRKNLKIYMILVSYTHLDVYKRQDFVTGFSFPTITEIKSLVLNFSLSLIHI